MKKAQISDLRDYNKVLKQVSPGEPVTLTKNGEDAYILMEATEFKKTRAIAYVKNLLLEAEIAERLNPKTYTLEEVREMTDKQIHDHFNEDNI
jgi:prevent-host-death family protein